MSVSELPTSTSPADLAAVRAVPQAIIDSWAKYDVEAFANVFAEDGTMILPNNVFAQGRTDIRSFMSAAFAGSYQGTKVTGIPVHARFLRDDICVLVSRGGVMAAGQNKVSKEREVLATWVLQKIDGEWKLASYQNTPVA